MVLKRLPISDKTLPGKSVSVVTMSSGIWEITSEQLYMSKLGKPKKQKQTYQSMPGQTKI